MRTKFVHVYAVIITCYAVWIHVGSSMRDIGPPATELDLQFVDFRAGSNKEWLGIKSVESYYTRDSARILHGDNLDIDWKLPRVTVVTKRYVHGRVVGSDVRTYDLSPNPPPTY